MNCLDENGLKQGLWQSWSLWYDRDEFGFIEKGQGKDYLINSEGQYLDNRKIGIWKFRDEMLGCYGFIYKQFHENGSVHKWDDCGILDLKINANSSSVEGTFVKNRTDTFSISCLNGDCRINLENFTVVSCQIKHLEFECLRIKSRTYDWQIQKFVKSKTQ